MSASAQTPMQTTIADGWHGRPSIRRLAAHPNPLGRSCADVLAQRIAGGAFTARTGSLYAASIRAALDAVPTASSLDALSHGASALPVITRNLLRAGLLAIEYRRDAAEPTPRLPAARRPRLAVTADRIAAARLEAERVLAQYESQFHAGTLALSVARRAVAIACVLGGGLTSADLAALQWQHLDWPDTTTGPRAWQLPPARGGARVGRIRPAVLFDAVARRWLRYWRAMLVATDGTPPLAGAAVLRLPQGRPLSATGVWNVVAGMDVRHARRQRQRAAQVAPAARSGGGGVASTVPPNFIELNVAVLRHARGVRLAAAAPSLRAFREMLPSAMGAASASLAIDYWRIAGRSCRSAPVM